MDIEWVIYHLIHNDDENFSSILDLDIDLLTEDPDQFDRLLFGLSRNRTVKRIELSRGYQSPVVTNEDLRRLFSALRHLSTLQKVKLDSFTTLDLEQTGVLFENNDFIEEIWIENAQYYFDDEEDNLDGEDTQEDCHRYETFLGYLSTMSRNHLRHLRIEVPEKLSHGANLASLLSGSSQLESLVIETTTVISSSPPSMLRAAHTEDDRRQKFAAAMIALQSNRVLKTLDMDFHISFVDFGEVATMLRHNNTLTSLCLRLDSSPEMIYISKNNSCVQDYHPHFIESIHLFFDALKTNTNSALRKFSQYNLDNREFRVAVSTHCEKSASNVICNNTAQKLIKIGLDMLQHNLSLEYFAFFLFDSKNSDLQKKKQMFLRLNKRGRRLVQHRDLREKISKSLWVDQLTKHSMDDLDGLYYYISANPSICRTIEEFDTCYTLSKMHACKAKLNEKRHLENFRAFDNSCNEKDSTRKRLCVDKI